MLFVKVACLHSQSIFKRNQKAGNNCFYIVSHYFFICKTIEMDLKIKIHIVLIEDLIFASLYVIFSIFYASICENEVCQNVKKK